SRRGCREPGGEMIEIRRPPVFRHLWLIPAALLGAGVIHTQVGGALPARGTGPAMATESPKWTILGPGGGGAQFVPAISLPPPASPQVTGPAAPQVTGPRRVLVACDMTGAYITNDAGESWRMFNLGWRVWFF